MMFHHVTWCSFTAATYVMHALCVASSAHSFSIVPWTLFQLLTSWCKHLIYALCDTCTGCGKLRSLFFYCTVNSFLTLNSLPTMNSMTYALCVVSSALSFSIVLWTLFRLWTLYQPWTPWRLRFGSAPCNARTTCGELRLLFFYFTVNSFPTMNSSPTENSVTHALI